MLSVLKMSEILVICDKDLRKQTTTKPTVSTPFAKLTDMEHTDVKHWQLLVKLSSRK